MGRQEVQEALFVTHSKAIRGIRSERRLVDEVHPQSLRSGDTDLYRLACDTRIDSSCGQANPRWHATGLPTY